MSQAIFTPSHIETTKMWEFLTFINSKTQNTFKTYSELYLWSIQKPEVFWSLLARFFNLKWAQESTSILKKGTHFWNAKWFEGSKFNYAQTLLTHPNEQLAIISIDETGQRQALTYGDLKKRVGKCRQGLLAAGVVANDRVVAVMPNLPETIIIMLASASLGAIFSSCSPDFGVAATIDRLGQLNPKILFISDGHRYGGKIFLAKDKIIALVEQMPSIEKAVIVQHIGVSSPLENQKNTVTFEDFGQETPWSSPQAFPFSHPLYAMFSSGTTGKPKCILHSAGGTLLQHLKELSLHTDLKDKDRLLFYTTCGWMMWNWMVSALALGVTLVLYEGSPFYPSPSRLFDIIANEHVNIFGTSAKYLASVEKSEYLPNQHHSLHALKGILSTGSPLLSPQYDFVYSHIKNDLRLCSVSGGTDIISCFALGNPILPIYKGELQSIGLGMDVAIFNDAGQAVYQERGELVCKAPFPSMPIGFWNDPENKAYQKSYFNRFNNVWAHGDFAEITDHQGLIIYGRSDAVLNPGGVRIGTAEIYRQLDNIPEILDAVVIGQQYSDDVRIILFVQLKPNCVLNEALNQRIKTTLKVNASPRHVPAKIIQVPDIPKTLNGKTVELAVKQMINKEPVLNLSSLANPDSLNYFKDLKILEEP